MKHIAALACVAVAAVAAVAAVTATAQQPGQPRQPGGPMSLVINLRRNPDRLARFTKAYERSDLTGVPLERVEAVDGAQLSDATLQRLLTPDALGRLRSMRESGFRQAHQDLTPGAVGCYMSHAQVWRTLASSDAPYAFVFEDDASPTQSTLARFNAARAQLPPEWDMLLLGYDGIDSTPVGPNVHAVTDFRRTHAYVVSAAGARTLLRSMLPMTQQVDWELSRQAIDFGLKVYGVVPEAVAVDWQGTDIQSPLQRL